MKKYIIIIFVLLIVVFAAIIVFLAMPEKKKNLEIPNDKILYFYSDTCSYCIAQKPIIEELEKIRNEVSKYEQKNRNNTNNTGINFNTISMNKLKDETISLKETNNQIKTLKINAQDDDLQ